MPVLVRLLWASSVNEEFDIQLQCGILAQSFLRHRLDDFSHDKQVAFNGRQRGNAPGGGRHLLYAGMPVCRYAGVPVRHGLLPLPIPLRLLLAPQTSMMTPVLPWVDG